MPDRPFPDGVDPSPQHIRAGILAYAAGDALGVPWEGKTPDEVHWEVLEDLPARGDWPRGSTSDDTDQMLLVARYLAETKGQVDERGFLTRLAKALPRMRGAGPTTRAAVRRFTDTGELRASEGSSIGAAMRALPFGWATPVAAITQRRELTVRLSRATHGAPVAIMSACVVAEMAAWAIEQHPIDAVVAAGLRESGHLRGEYGLDSAAVRSLQEAADGDWESSTGGMTPDAVGTMATVLRVLRQATGLASAMKQAVAWGATPTLRPLSSEEFSAPKPEMSNARFRGYPASCYLSPRQSKQRRQGYIGSGDPSIWCLREDLLHNVKVE